jgi:hypothetical protein
MFITMSTVGLFLAVAPMRAHHAFSAEFDSEKPVKLQGTVTQVEWVNPHAWIHIDVKGPNGKAVPWTIEASTPNTLYRRGFNKESLTPGTVIIIEGYRAKDGSNKANGRDLTLPDGRKLFMGSADTGAPNEQK